MAEKIKDETNLGQHLLHSFNNLKPVSVLKKEQEVVLLRKKCIRLKSDNEELRSSLKEANQTAASRFKKINALQEENKEQKNKIHELTEKIKQKDQQIFSMKKRTAEYIIEAKKNANLIFGKLKQDIESDIQLPDDKNSVQVVDIDDSLQVVDSDQVDSDQVRDSSPHSTLVPPPQLNKKSSTFKCTYPACDKIFTRKYNLLLHTRVHNAFRPEKCTVDGCNKKFSHPSNLKRHIKTHEK